MTEKETLILAGGKLVITYLKMTMYFPLSFSRDLSESIQNAFLQLNIASGRGVIATIHLMTEYIPEFTVI